MKYIWNINVIQSLQGGYGEIYAYDYYGGSPELFPRGEIHIYNNYFDNRRKILILVNYSHEICLIPPVL